MVLLKNAPRWDVQWNTMPKCMAVVGDVIKPLVASFEKGSKVICQRVTNFLVVSTKAYLGALDLL
jgi:hypothetical protein